MTADGLKWHPVIDVLKYGPEKAQHVTDVLGREPKHEDFLALGIEPDDTAHSEGNQLVTVGLDRLGKLITGQSTTAFTSAQGIVGVGSGTTAWAATQTALAGDGSTSSAYYQIADAAPSASNGVISANCTYQSGNANFSWNEWCWIIATGTITAGGTLASVGTSPVMLNRKVQSLGTKANGSIWTLSAVITLS